MSFTQLKDFELPYKELLEETKKLKSQLATKTEEVADLKHRLTLKNKTSNIKQHNDFTINHVISFLKDK